MAQRPLHVPVQPDSLDAAIPGAIKPGRNESCGSQAHLAAIVASCTDAVLSTDLNGMVLLAMTGWGLGEDKRQAIEAGIDAHLTKPVEIDVLESALESRYKPPSAQGPHSA